MAGKSANDIGRSHIVAVFPFFAYLKSTYVGSLHNEERLGLAERGRGLAVSVETARTAIKGYFERVPLMMRLLLPTTCDHWIEPPP